MKVWEKIYDTKKCFSCTFFVCNKLKNLYNHTKFTLNFWLVAKKKAKKSYSNPTRNIILASILILLSAIWFFSETDSTLGYWMTEILSRLFWEYFKWVFSPVTALFWIFLFVKEWYSFTYWRFFGLLLFFLWVTTLIGSFSYYEASFNISLFLRDLLWKSTATLLSVVMVLLSLYLLFRISYKKIIKKVVSYTPDIDTIKEWFSPFKSSKNEGIEEKKTKKSSTKSIEKEIEKERIALEKMKKEFEKEKILQEKKSKKQLNLDDAPLKIAIEKKSTPNKGWIFGALKNAFEDEKSSSSSPKKTSQNYDAWQFPSLDLLRNVWWDIEIDDDEIQYKQQEIAEKLKQFKIDVKMKDYRVWPTVIQFRLKPEEWVKLNKIVNLKNDLTLALHAKSIRIQAPIPGQWVVWIEVPNENRQAVWLKEVLQDAKFRNTKMDIPLAIWKDVNGDIVVWDLTKMPHLLVAWQTASGKSVGMNGFILSMLYTFTPSELKLIMIDPKMVELSIYNGIPHLLTPVITNSDKALNALKWAVAEMLRRYDLATAVNARNLKEYNAKVEKEKKLPYIVIVLDELADLMMSGNKKEVEGSIARIAQMARAVWMHLIVATQRPSVDVITWLIKANIPSRIAFTVASQIDSRTVIDKAGAEDLLWRGDMLYSPTGSLEPERVQGVLVETPEIEAIVKQLKMTVDPDMLKNLYDDTIVNGKSNLTGSILEKYNGDQEEDPEIIEKAIQVVKDAKKWSTSLIQRKLWLGYARAAKVLDILEELWVVWPANGSKPRDVYD